MQHLDEPQLPLLGTGPRLKAAREAAGVSRAEIASRTRISERVIALIEAGDFAGLPSRTYAIGFTRSYARMLGLDPEEYVAGVREEMGLRAATEDGNLPAYEPGDPARVPTARFAWIAALLALGLIAAGLVFWRNYYVPAVTLPSILPAETPAPPPAPKPGPAVLPAAVPTGPAVNASALAVPPTAPAGASAAPSAAIAPSTGATAAPRPHRTATVRHTPAPTATPDAIPAAKPAAPAGDPAASTVTN